MKHSHSSEIPYMHLIEKTKKISTSCSHNTMFKKSSTAWLILDAYKVQLLQECARISAQKSTSEQQWNQWYARWWTKVINRTRHKKSKHTELWFLLGRQTSNDSQGKCNDVSEQESTALTTVLAWQGGRCHQVCSKSTHLTVQNTHSKTATWSLQIKTVTNPHTGTEFLACWQTLMHKNKTYRHNSTMTLSSCLHIIPRHTKEHFLNCARGRQKRWAFCWTSSVHKKTLSGRRTGSQCVYTKTVPNTAHPRHLHSTFP